VWSAARVYAGSPPNYGLIHAQLARELGVAPLGAVRPEPSLIEWTTMTQEELSARFKGSPIKRARRGGLLRNVAVALGNRGSPEALPALAVGARPKL
jgi:hypothetical protein